MKNRKFSTPLGMGLTASFLAAGLAGAATLSINEALAPTTNIITSSPQGGSFTRAFHDNGGKITRGSSLLAPDTGDANTGYSVTGLTIGKNGDQTFGTGDTLQLWMFEYSTPTTPTNSTNWVQGDGLDVTGTPGGDTDPLNGTGSTLLLAESFNLNGLGQLNTGTFITFDFSSSPLTMQEDTAYGFLIGYATGGVSGQTYFQFEQINVGSYAFGNQIRTVGASNTVDGTIDTRFYLTGTAVPEPSAAALLLLGAAGLLRRRRR